MEATSVSPILLSIFLLMEDITTLITSSPGGIPMSGRAAIIGCVDILLATPSDGMILSRLPNRTRRFEPMSGFFVLRSSIHASAMDTQRPLQLLTLASRLLDKSATGGDALKVTPFD